MIFRHVPMIMVAGGLTSVAFAHADVQNVHVKARMDAMSEARSEIWTNWEDFVARAEALERVADTLRIIVPEDVGPALGALGATCKACHSDYRV